MMWYFDKFRYKLQTCAIQVKGLVLVRHHSDANYNINNFKFIDNGSITDKNYDLLKNLYPLDGYRNLKIVGEKK